MDSSWDSIIPTPSPEVKLEASPMDSLLSEPSGVYPSLFAGSTMAPSATSTPLDTGASSMPLFLADGDDIAAITKSGSFQPMTPLPEADEAMSDEDTPDPESSEMDDQAADGSSPGKKPTKKRKSWGQVLPEPKTNLPPRKRAKTEDEKEQRRVERVLRNRRAAQSSRERKRLEVEALEKRNQDLEDELKKARRENMMLYQQLANAQGKPVVIPTGNAPVTLSQELFSTQPSATLDSYLVSQSAATINPVSLSPSLHPVPDTSNLISAIDGHEKTAEKDAVVESLPTQTAKTQPTNQTSNDSDLPEPFAATDAGASVTPAPESSPDMTQRPAATLCPDLQCLSAEEPQVWTASQKAMPLAAALFSQVTGYLDSPESGNSDFNYLVDNDAVGPFAAADFDINDFFNADGHNMPSGGDVDFGDSSLPIAGAARPHTTTQNASEDPDLQPYAGASLEGCDAAATAVGMVQAVQWSETGIAPDGSWQNTATLPSQEVLLTLLWALRVEERRQLISAKANSMPPVTTMSLSKGLMPRLKRSIDGMCLDDKSVLPTANRRKQRRLD
ncbi:transcriptional activator hac1 [Ophiostoma piceae UAMH 11346]|uniref:Transcriptional activator hac1 n=1 Tax=Ophiostoma piceae (strain UAMH 11346) TaxID=1262450 RepID=S3CKF8_OPHP1|nr:transcriptional activator hac1 [Ophiostoma piceae UAMH 11346]